MALRIECDNCGAQLGEEFIRVQVNWRGTIADICLPCFMTKTSFEDTFYSQIDRPDMPPPPNPDVPTAKTPQWVRP